MLLRKIPIINLISPITNYIFPILPDTCLFRAEYLKSEFRQARLELDSLSVQKDSLENKYSILNLRL